MLTGMAAVRNLLLGEQTNLWNINADKEYHEEVREVKADPVTALPKPVSSLGLTRTRAIRRIDSISLGVAVGFNPGMAVFMTTVFLLFRGGANIGANLQLLAQFFRGYQITFAGSFIGLMYGFIVGFVMGSAGAYLRNLLVYLTAHALYRDIQRNLLRRFLDHN